MSTSVDKPLSKRKKAPLHMSRKPTDKGKHWTDRDKLKAIAAYSVLGNATKVEEQTGIPAGTVNYWKTLPWWFEEMEKLRKSEDEELVSSYTKIIKQTINKLEERIEQGDIVFLRDGSERSKPISARDLASITNVVADKRHKLRHDAVEQQVKTLTVSERLKQLEDQFIKFATSKVVEGEVIHKSVEISAPEVENAENLEETPETTGGEGSQELLGSGIESAT